MKKTFTYLFLLIFLSSPAWAAVHYIDPTAGSGGDGSYGSPWDSWTDVSSWTASDTYAQKCGTTDTGVNLDIDAASVVITAYYTGPVLENASPSMGTTCGNDAAKPILQGAGGATVVDLQAAGITLNSIQVANATTSSAVRVIADNAVIRYCVIGDTSQFGIRLGPQTDGDNPTVQYNIIDSNGYGASSTDGINVGTLVDDGDISYNFINDWDHSGIIFAGSSNGLDAYYNYITDDQASQSECFVFNADTTGHTVHHNYCKDAGIVLFGGCTNVKFYNNVIDGIQQGDSTSSDAAMTLQNVANYDVTGNLIYNNTVYGSGTGADSLKIVALVGSTGDISGNYLRNNIFLSGDRDGIRIYDNTAGDVVIGKNYFDNNLVYGQGDDYADIESEQCSSAAEFNGEATCDSGDLTDNNDNLDSDPSLSNASGGELWPDSSQDPVINSGYDIGTDYDDYILSTSDFTAYPPDVNTSQESTHDIGAYTLKAGLNEGVSIQ